MTAAAPLPWYRHFWPWFVVCLLGSSIAMSLTTAYIAISGRDPEVRDDWASDAKAVIRQDGPERRARDLGLAASVTSSAIADELEIELHALPGLAPDRLDVVLAHPTLADRDVDLTLERGDDGLYRGALPSDTEGRYQIWILGRMPAVSGSSGEQWKLAAPIELTRGEPTRLDAVAAGQ